MNEKLREAIRAIRTREYYSAFAESPSPKVYGDAAAGEGRAAFEAHLGSRFQVSTPGSTGDVATETSPYGLALDVSYPRVDAKAIEELMAAARAGMRGWRDAGPERRTEVCVQVLEALHARIFELANAVQHTTGQAFVMAFQAGGAHALDRALEALAYAHEVMSFHPPSATWTKPGRSGPLVMDKTFTVVPCGVALVVGCNTFPTWNSFPGLFSSLSCGNPVIIKPHPRAVLPLAITAQVCQQVLAEAGFDPHLVTLAVEGEGDQLAKELALHPAVRLIDFTGGNDFGDWLEQNAHQARVFTEKSGVNAIVLDSTDDFNGMCQNLAFTLALYSGQMCTTSQNIFIPADGIATDDGRVSPADVALGIGAAIERLLGDDARGVELLGAIVSPAVLRRLERAERSGKVVVASRAIAHPSYPDAVVRTPLMVAVDAGSSDYQTECFGPVSFLISTASTEDSLTRFGQTVTEHGAMTAGIYSTDEEVLAAAREVALQSGVALSENLTGSVYVNQSAAFSDFHGTGANPAANASYIDLAYVASRFHLVQSRRPGVPPTVCGRDPYRPQ
ncbi:phenylacetic acid degradation protein PaaN [Microlunatus panaciterrae]|uniref:Phenylacetic acid degradation protein paaN n=1 Tax=Microlunatus panaciterrae TaxID=400768 RepID=A0ABS2RJH6_9ACTN|nr:phenylacetic acid degradation protein PaaN [Microlunatus panaciterrae]MBM7798717.1 phenylacetic acid degradation protein paaN [Microlunatus panaciterrae]